MKSDGRTKGPDATDLVKGLAAGLIGGLVASWTMNQFQALAAKLTEEMEKSPGGKKKQPATQKEGDDATVKAASAISEGVFDHKLAKSEKKIAGPAVHYAMGAPSGAFYGALAELLPTVTLGAGLPFGTGVWLIADEAALPALGLAKSPTEIPFSTHAYALASHLVYGLTTELVRRGVRNAL